MHITVCICTYKRASLLKRLLEDVIRQETEGKFTYSVVVADNDRLGSAEPIVRCLAVTAPIKVTYCVEPEQNIALVRNRAVANATGDFLAFIDDDEFPPKDWLLQLLNACNKYNADGVLAPVRPHFEHAPPAWLVRGRFCERPEHETGYVLSWRQTRTGNVLFRRKILDGVAEPFRREFGAGGEDQEFFRRMIEHGSVFIWCNEAAVHEIVPPERCRRSYILRRALLRGQNEKNLTSLGGIGKSLVAVPAYALMLPFLALIGQHLALRYLIRLLDHAGKLLSIVGLKPAGDRYVAG